MNKYYIILLSILFVVVVLISGVFFFNKDEQSLNVNMEITSEENLHKTIVYESGDFIYTPSEEEINYDHEEKVFFYENLLNVFLASEISNDEAMDLANTVNGNLVGKIQGSLHMIQIQVEEDSLKALQQLADQLEDEGLVKYASTSSPTFISDLETEKIDEANPDGNNWWAEAINAYSAWYYVDQHQDAFEQIDVAVLEIGKLGENDHESNDGSIHKDSVTITEFSSEEAEYYTIGESNISHAELVTKIIAADQNPQTIRGVAEPIANIKFTSIGRLSPEETVDQIDFNHTDSISDLEIISLIKKSIEDEGAKVINNSWGNPPMSKEKWKKDNTRECNI